MARKFRCRRVSWGEVQRLARRLALAIRADGFRPDLIVAIARGGYVPARLLADYLGIMRLASFRVAHYAAGARARRRARVVEPLAAAVAGRRVLVVDDVADSGDTWIVALRHLARRRPLAVRTAALHYKAGSRFEPDYYAARLKEWRWLIYPWARLEDTQGFLARLTPRPATAAVAAQRLARAFGLHVSRGLIADALRFTDPAAVRRPPPAGTGARGARAPRRRAGTRSRRRMPR